MNQHYLILLFIIVLQFIYLIDSQRKPYLFGLTAESALVKYQLVKGALIGLYIFIAVAGLLVVIQDIYHFIIKLISS